MTDQNQMQNDMQSPAETTIPPLAFLLARPSYIVYIHFDQNESEFAWTLLPVPMVLRGRDFSTQPLSELMSRLMAKFKCVVKSHVAVEGVNEGTPMRCLNLQAIGAFVEKDANNRTLNGWATPNVSDLEIANIQLPFQMELENCAVPTSDDIPDEGIIEA